MKLKNAGEMIKLLVAANESGAGFADGMIAKLTEDREAFDSLLLAAAETSEARGAIVRAIISHFGASSAPSTSNKRPIDEPPGEMDRIFQYLKTHQGEFLSRAIILTGAKIPNDAWGNAWHAAMISGHVESNGKKGRGAEYRYKP